ncbi:exported hypothetical protein [uncultured Desulfobacterium sp.]|uniref:PKD domain-containing protein n=1 Tax=uncultured Desulfobacterium sp. TaxID=201089 RepID=A0A445MYM2_9BACT|nr:exported hypothetical protein [uncultured Desulfobacterium sp.]
MNKRGIIVSALLCAAVFLMASIASAGVSKVLGVPWQGNPAAFHTAISGQSVNLYAVVYGDATGGSASYSWDFKDGTAPATGSISVPANGIYNLTISHTFSGAIGSAFDTELTVGGQTDDYNIVLAPDNNDSKVNIAIDKGLWYLHTEMIRTNSGTPSVPVGYWNDNGAQGNVYVGRTSPCVWAFEVQGHLLSVETNPLTPMEDPYVEDVQRGINFLLTRTFGQTIGAQTYGNPDTNGNGYGLYCYYSSSHTNYENGLAMGAISGCGTPNATAATGQATYVLGRTYQAIVQDMVDWYAWGQIDDASFPFSGARGGWYYTANVNYQQYGYAGYYGDNSASQWAYIGLDAAEANFGCTIPIWMKQQLAGYLRGQLVGRGYVSYRAGYSDYTTPNVCLTGGALVGMALVGETIYNSLYGAGAFAADQTSVKTFLGNYWRGQDWRWTENWYGHRAYYTMYAFMKGARLNGINSLPGSPGTSDWYGDYVSVMLPDQYSDGHWRGTGWMDGYIVEDMGTAFAILILTPSVFSPPPVACFDAEPNPGYLDIPISFDPTCSYHSDAGKNIVLYEWDWNNDGIYDASSVTPDNQTHTWDSGTYGLGSYPVVLRVTDDTTPVPVTDTYTLNVNLTIPPHPPVADVGGPYVVSLCQNDSLMLDGSGSWDVDEGQSESGNPPFDAIIAWDWDLNGAPWNYSDGSGEIFASDPSILGAGSHTIGLRVTDNTAAAYPGSQQPNLTDEDFGTVTVYNACDACDLTSEIGCKSVELSWSTSGTYDVLRSTDGPNSGFSKIGEVTGTGYTDDTVVSGTTYYYRLRGADCMSGSAEITYVYNSQLCPCVDNLAARAKLNKIQLTWTHTGADSYNVYRSTVAGGPYVFRANTTSTYSTYLDSGLVIGTTYYYVVREVRGGVETCQSNEASARPTTR